MCACVCKLVDRDHCCEEPCLPLWKKEVSSFPCFAETISLLLEPTSETVWRLHLRGEVARTPGGFSICCCTTTPGPSVQKLPEQLPPCLRDRLSPRALGPMEAGGDASDGLAARFKDILLRGYWDEVDILLSFVGRVVPTRPKQSPPASWSRCCLPKTTAFTMDWKWSKCRTCVAVLQIIHWCQVLWC